MADLSKHSDGVQPRAAKSLPSMQSKYLEYLIGERERWEAYLRVQNLSIPGYAIRASDQIERITNEIDILMPNLEINMDVTDLLKNSPDTTSRKAKAH